MRKTTHKSIAIFVICSLLSIFAVPAMAWDWPCPDVCYYWDGYECILSEDCGIADPCPGECCYCTFCYCVDDDSKCSDCYSCENCDCVPCKCWDDGDPISGSITVQDANLCEVVIHTSSISDTDHWSEGGNGEGNPTDTISSYAWDQAADTNPQTGTFTGATDEDTVEWQAPPCTGTVIIKLDADDEPDSMDNPCPDSDRDDSNNVFEGTSTVSLPSGCSNAGPHDSSVHWDDGQDYNTTIWWGQCLNFKASYDVDFKYGSCDWVCEISNVKASTLVLVGNPSRPGYVSITQASDVPCEPSSEPLLAKSDLYDTDLDDDEGPPLTKYWIHSAIVAHEEYHRTDWKGFYKPRLEDATSYCESLNTVIVCETAYTRTCQGALDYWDGIIEDTFDLAYDYALADYDNPATELKECEQRAYMIDSYINHPVSDALPEGCGS